MTWLGWAVVEGAAALAAMLTIAGLTAKPAVERLADPAPMPGELPAAGFLSIGPVDYHNPRPAARPGRTLAEDVAELCADTEREIGAMIREAERKGLVR